MNCGNAIRILPGGRRHVRTYPAMEKRDDLSVLLAEPQISVHDFGDNILGNQIFFHVIKLSESFHISVGTSPVIKSIAVAMKTKYVSSTSRKPC